MNAREQLLLTYSDLEDGEHRAGELCPACKGGSSGERTLSVTHRDGKLVWICHRDSCNFRGASGAATHSNARTSKPVSTRGVWGRRLAEDASTVPHEVRCILEERYGIADRHITQHELGWDTETNRLTIPVKDFLGNRLGVVLRALDNRKPKTLTHTEQGAISWHVNHTAPGVIIVEDQLSAIRASDYLTSVALLGTHLNDERADEIRASKLSPVYLALDADAWATAVRHAINYRSQLSPVLVRLEKDIKDHTDQELTEVIASMKE